MQLKQQAGVFLIEILIALSILAITVAAQQVLFHTTFARAAHQSKSFRQELEKHKFSIQNKATNCNLQSQTFFDYYSCTNEHKKVLLLLGYRNDSESA